MESNNFFDTHRHYYFGEKQPEKRVERKDSIEPDGRHKIELQLAFDNEEAQKAVLRFIAEINNLRKVDNMENLAGITTWLAGYLAALLMAEVVDTEQAEQLENLLDIASRQQAKLIGIRKRG